MNLINSIGFIYNEFSNEILSLWRNKRIFICPKTELVLCYPTLLFLGHKSFVDYIYYSWEGFQ